jgi:ribonuclease E
MAKRMLIDATHPEETRVVVLNGNRLEEFDFESSTKRQVKGNIYLAKVTRVEPSLQAAFVDYGGNRHGFLAFSEIHPDYYRIPVADRELTEHETAADEVGAQQTAPDEAGVPLAEALPEPVPVPPEPEGAEDEAAETEGAEAPGFEASEAEGSALQEPTSTLDEGVSTGSRDWEPRSGTSAAELPWEDVAGVPATLAPVTRAEPAESTIMESEAAPVRVDEPTSATAELLSASPTDYLAAEPESGQEVELGAGNGADIAEADTVETIEADDLEEDEQRPPQTMRHYKIQEVIKRRQIMLVQVSKEERGTKGAALTTYLSLAGRYCVLMPNTARGGGVSRKIINLGDRRRLKEILEQLDIPEGMGVIVRTAGAERSKAEIKRDYEYLLRLWNEIRDLTLKSTAPALIYEEGNLIKRSIRDLYTRDIDEVLVEGEEGYRTAKAFMKMLMPSHARRVQPYRDPQIGLLHRFQVESQIDAIHSPVVQLRSGGYVVINQTEALVAIDVNSGRSTRERNIEETAVRTNLEAAEEIARQLRLRDLAGLIVIDFIDMEEHRNQAAVERRLKEALKSDRARIQVGRISPFGLLEMSRQRLRPSLVEISTQPCPHCGGTGFIRSTESTALYVLRSIEEEGMRRRSAEICVYVPTTVALYILNQKRDSLVQLESRYGLRVLVARDDALIPPTFRLERLRAYAPTEPTIAQTAPLTQAPEIEDESDEIDDEAEAMDRKEQDGDEERSRTRRRRRRRRRRDEEAASAAAEGSVSEEAGTGPEELVADDGPADGGDEGEDETDAERRRRRRGRRGGRRRSRREGALDPVFAEERTASEMVEILPTPDTGEPEPTPLQASDEPFVESRFAAPEDVAVTEGTVGPLPSPLPSVETATVSESPEHPEQGAPVASPSERSPVPLPVDEGQPEPQPSVETVTGKPASPRRGWWQRLIQS